MAKKATKKLSRPSRGYQARATPIKKKASSSKGDSKLVCAMPEVPQRVLPQGIDSGRTRLIRENEFKWVNGTKLRYFFFDRQSDGEHVFFTDGSREWRTWVGADREVEAMRECFKVWQDVGIGLEFEEVDDRDEAEVRIGFMRGDGSWSYLGRQILDIGHDARTMNIGWSLQGDLDTGVHEIGHTLGFPHEHQNPNAGIVWDEEKVYEDLAGPPNNWSRDKTFHNIIRKIEPDSVQGSNWDPNSIMHYPFGKGLIKQPEQFKNGLQPAPGLSDRDKTWVKEFYPAFPRTGHPKLVPFESQRLSLTPGQQANFVIEPNATRDYTIQTFGRSDTVIVLFEDVSGELRYAGGNDDSGSDLNAKLTPRLRAGRRYVLRIRLYWTHVAGDTAVLLW